MTRLPKVRFAVAMAGDARFPEIRATLYALPPEEFIAARDAAAATARSDLARKIRALRRPTLSAWLVNLLAAHRTEQLADLLAIGDRLRDAHHTRQGGQLRELSAMRQTAISSLVTLARRLAVEHGKQVREETLREAESTLRAAVADPAVAAQARAGAMVKATRHSGMGILEPAWGDAAAQESQNEPPDAPLRWRGRLRVIRGGRHADDGDRGSADDGERSSAPPKSGTAAKRSSSTRADRAHRERSWDAETRHAAVLAEATRELERSTAAEREAAQRLAQIATELDQLRARERQLRDEQAEHERNRRRSQRRKLAAEKAVSDVRRKRRR